MRNLAYAWPNHFLIPHLGVGSLNMQMYGDMNILPIVLDLLVAKPNPFYQNAFSQAPEKRVQVAWFADQVGSSGKI